MKRSINSSWITRSVPAPGGGTLKVTCPIDEPQWFRLAPACWGMNLPGFEPVTCSPFSKVQRGFVESEADAVYLKKFLVRGWRDAVKGMFRSSRAYRAWRGDLLMARAGFSAPRVRCLIRPGRMLGSESMLVTDEVREAVSVKKRLTDPQHLLPAGSRFGFIRAFAREAAALHRAGLWHGDMRTNNILARETAGGWEFIWLDNERNRRYRKLPGGKRDHNLMQVNMDRPGINLNDRLCFWRAYARAAGLTKDELSRTVRRVRTWTRQRWRARGWLEM